MIISSTRFFSSLFSLNRHFQACTVSQRGSRSGRHAIPSHQWLSLKPTYALARGLAFEEKERLAGDLGGRGEITRSRRNSPMQRCSRKYVFITERLSAHLNSYISERSRKANNLSRDHTLVKIIAKLWDAYSFNYQPASPCTQTFPFPAYPLRPSRLSRYLAASFVSVSFFSVSVLHNLFSLFLFLFLSVFLLFSFSPSFFRSLSLGSESDRCIRAGWKSTRS